MRYVVFSVIALFVTACGDPDNPVVYTAPAGKAVQQPPPGTNQPSSIKLVGNFGQQPRVTSNFVRDYRQDFTTGPDVHSWKLRSVKIYMEVYPSLITLPTFAVEIWTTGSDGMLMERIGTLTHPYSLVSHTLNEFTGDIDLDANTTYALVVDVTAVVTPESAVRLQSTWSVNEDSDSVAGWSISDDSYRTSTYSSTNWDKDLNEPYRIEIHGYAIPLFTQSEIDAYRTRQDAPGPDDFGQEAWDTGDPTLRESVRNLYRHEQLREANVLPTVSVSGCQDGSGNAVFTFSRNGPTTEHLSFVFNVSGGPNDGQRIRIGFTTGTASFEWNGGAVGSDKVHVWIDPSWHNDEMSGDFIRGTREATVNSASSTCP